MAQSAGSGILAGFRILDLADEKGLPAAKFFADLGADVLKIERPGGDPARSRPPFAQDDPHPERSLYWLHWNANKRGITLDLATPDGQALFRQLAAKADVVLETFRPGTLEGWGLGYEALAAANPGLIMTSITTYGQTGPYRDYEGDELTAFALGGLMALSGEPGGPPLAAPGDLASGMASMHAALATQVALFHRLRGGLGQHIDVSVSDAAAHIGGYVASYFSYHGEKPVRVSHLDPQFELHDVYPCKDGWARLFILPRAHWLEFLNWLGKPPELDDPVFEDQNMRRENSDLINPYVLQLCAQYTKQELYLEAQRRHLAVTPVNEPGDFVESPQTEARGYFLDAEHPVVGKYRQVGPLHKYSALEPRVERSAPLVGEHNEDVLGGELGLSRADLASLRAAGVI